MDKRRKKRRNKRNSFYKLLLVLILLCISGYGIWMVNDTIAEMDYLENPNIFKLDFGERRMVLFGRSYYIDFKILKEWK